MGRKSEIQRIQLEKLMGPEAMGLTTEQLHFTDAKVCRNFLCGTCPHDLFSNTKVDLGTCPKSHTARLKDEFKSALQKGEEHPQFEAEYEDNIRMFMADIDRKIAANKRRIDQTPEETAKFTNLMHDISEIETAMNNAMAEVERLGEQGEVEESLKELQRAEALRAEKAERERDLQILSDSAGASGHQKLRVCDVCGAYLSILDSDRRLADHFGGRMHLGYLRLREIITEFDERRSRGEDPRTLMARGVGARGPTNGHGVTPSGPAGNGYASPAPPPPGLGPRAAGGMNGSSGGYGGRPSYGPPGASNPSSSYGYPAPAPSLNYGESSGHAPDGDRSRDRDRERDRERERDGDRERRERERRDRREGRDYRDRSPEPRDRSDRGDRSERDRERDRDGRDRYSSRSARLPEDSSSRSGTSGRRRSPGGTSRSPEADRYRSSGGGGGAERRY